MNREEELNALEGRLIDLEFERLKRIHGQQSILITTSKPPAKTSWQLRLITMSNGKQYQFRSASGAWRMLPADRKLWPAEVREMKEKFEAFDEKRRVGHRIASNIRDAD